MSIKIGTRTSPLAMRQARLAMLELRKNFPTESFEIVGITTEGDRDRTSVLSSFGGRGVFIKEIERALLEGEIDMAVHSAKDMPTELPEGLEIGAALRRAAHEDTIVTCGSGRIRTIGTGSARRAAQIKGMYPQAEIKPIRGNIETRLEKLKSGEYDAIIIAKAAIERLEIQDRSIRVTVLEDFVSAAGQGIIAVEVRKNSMGGFMDALNDKDTMAALKAERAFLRAAGGGCHAPIGAYARVSGEKIIMETMLERDGRIIINEGEGTDPEELGRRMYLESSGK